MNGQEWRERYKCDALGEGPRHDYAGFPKVTLSASTEAGLRESFISVLEQRSYTGGKPVISSSLADTPCTSFSVKGLIRKLNVILGTSYTVETCSLSTLLEDYIGKGYDFGTVYGRLRPFWYLGLTDIKYKLQAREQWDRQMRRDVLQSGRSVVGCTPVSMGNITCVDERRGSHTPINGYEWPVPMPTDADLDLIRIEMLNKGAEYVWLDVLCLRQEGKWEERLEERRAVRRAERRAERHDRHAGRRRVEKDAEREDRRVEWAVDVSTIGRVYQMAHKNQLVCYLSGLGRPFSLKEDDLQSDRCWFRRAWTLQEVNKAVIIGGNTGDEGSTGMGMRRWVDEELSSLEESIKAGGMGIPVFTALSKMRKRASVGPLDKISGLAYLLRTAEIPPYSEAQDEEDAWTALVDELNVIYRGHLFFLYPKRGNRNMFWRPSWEQAMTGTLPPPHLSDHGRGWSGNVCLLEEGGDDLCDGPCIDSGLVTVGGLSRRSQGDFRWGELKVEDNTGAKHTFKIVADHQYSIPEGSYALVGSDPYDSKGTLQERQFWVVGERLPGEVFKKRSVFQIPNKEDVERLHELGVTINTKTVLV